MNSFTYCNPVNVIFGLGSFAQAGAEAAKLGRRALVVMSAGRSAQAPWARLQSLLAEAGVEASAFRAGAPAATAEPVSESVTR